ncbi:hypothetical protein D3C86_1997720 [compost metagenome]
MHLGQVGLQGAGVILDEDVLQNAPARRRLPQRANGPLLLAFFEQATAFIERVGQAGQAADQLAALGAGMQGEEQRVKLGG